jgi:hypothetical protein
VRAILAFTITGLVALAVAPAAGADLSGYRECPSRYWGAGAMNLQVKNIRCSSAHYVLLGGPDRRRNLRRGGFKCRRERNAENVVWLYWCLSGNKRLFFNTD